jgi:hypothetical protein
VLAADDIVIGLALAQSGPVEGYDDNGTKLRRSSSTTSMPKAAC